MFIKRMPVKMYQVNEPFTCANRENQLFTAQAGDWLAQDQHGGYYAISDEFHRKNYVRYVET